MPDNLSSDIEIVSAAVYHNQDAGKVPYGSIFPDVVGAEAADGYSIESLQPDAVRAVDWRGLDESDAVVVAAEPKKRGRPAGSKNKVKVTSDG